MNILIVDHTLVYHQIFEQSLGNFTPFSLQFAASAAEALDLTGSETFQFVAVSRFLPDGDGLELIRQLRESGRLPYEPIVLLTSTLSAEIATQAEQAGATEVFRKHDIDELVCFLRRFRSVFLPLKGNVLYVEDSASQRAALSAQLVEWGLQVSAFASAEEAWESFSQKNYDLVITDIVLSGRMTGSRLVNRIRRLPDARGDVLILAVTAFDSALRRIELFQLGIDDYVCKPLVPGELHARIQNMLARKDASDRQLRTLSLAIEQSPESILITGPDAQIEFVNEGFVQLSGYTSEEVMGTKPSILSADKVPAEQYQALWTALNSGSSWKGEFVNFRKDGSEYTESVVVSPVRDGSGNICNYLAVCQDITEQKRAEAKIHQLANFDVLTGLPNRTLLLDRVMQRLASRRRADFQDALILFDIDHFKKINDAHDHRVGDALLKALAERIGSVLMAGDTLARMSADEFAILLLDQESGLESMSHHILSVADKIHACLRHPIHVSGKSFLITGSMGVTLFPELPDDSPDTILRRVATALHRAKAEGRNQTAFFEAKMGEVAAQRYGLECALRQGIPDGELRLHLQPQVDAQGEVVGAEALVRWQHNESGLLLPGSFIPIAEESDLIIELGKWVLEKTAELINGADWGGHVLPISVNLSARHFRQQDFVPWMKNLLVSHHLDPASLMLEVTESLVIENVEDVVNKMNELTAIGLRFSIDDFGTGYSSLAYLKRMPIHELKIDKTFIQDAPTNQDDAALVETILAVAKQMKLRVVAEGVETEEQAAFLNARAKMFYQGYLYGRPEQAEDWIAKRKNLMLTESGQP